MPEFLMNLFLTIIGSLLLYFLIPAFSAAALAYWACLVISAVIVFGGFFIITEGDFI